MLRYSLRRVLHTIPVLWLVYTTVFVMLRIIPGGPWSEDKPMPPAVVEALNRKYGLDKPLWQQYLDYLAGLLRGDLGPSYAVPHRTVAEIIGEFFPVSLQLGLLAMALALTIGISVGVVAALNHNTWIDRMVMFVTILGVSIPHFVMASCLILLFAVVLRVLPAGGWDGIFSTKAIIPAFALALGPAARLARFSRSSMLEVIRKEYILTARAKGLRERIVIGRHALKNAFIPVVTVAGVSLAFIVTGSFFVETVAVVPGLGRYFVSSINNRDYPMVLGTVLLLATIIAFVNLVVDLIYGYLDPRIRYD